MVLAIRGKHPRSNARYSRGRKAMANPMRRLNGIVLALPLIVLGFVGCAGQTNPARPNETKLSVTPAKVTVAAGSTTDFKGVFTPTAPTGGSLTWSVAPATAGTVSSAGVFTASSNPGKYSVIATWTPAVVTAKVVIIDGSAKVEILAVPQLASVNSPDMVQASGGSQTNGAIQNVAIVGQPFPSVTSEDAAGNIQVRTGFTPPVACPGTSNVC